MKYKLFIFCIILFSLNTIILGNLGNEILSIFNQEKTIDIDVTNKYDKSNLYMTMTNDTMFSTAKINVYTDHTHDLIEINITCKNKTNFNLTFYNGTQTVKPKQSANEKYIFVLKVRDIPKDNKLYIMITIDETETKEEDIDFVSKDYLFFIEHKLDDYDFPYINDEDDKRYSADKEISYVRNNELLYGGKKIVITFLGSGMNTFKVEYAYDDSKNYKALEKNFFNGYGLIIDNTILTINEERIKFKITKIADYEMVHVETRIYSNGHTTIYPYDSFDIILYKNKSDSKKECFELDKSVVKDASKKYTLTYISYTKNIEAKYSPNNNNKPINQESMYEEVNGFDSVCFEINDSNQNAIGTLSLELMDISINEPKKDDNEYRVIRALPTYHYLYKSASFVFKPEVYNLKSDNVLNIHFKMIEGVSQLSTGTFTNSGFNINKEYTHFNGFIFVRESLSTYNDKTFAMVKCIDKKSNCKYVIEIKEESEKSYFYPDLRWYEFISKNNIGNYMINVKDKKNNDLLLNINSFSYNPSVDITIGSKNITLTNKNNDNFLLNNKISYNIQKSDFASQEYIYIKVTNTDNSDHIFYGINYQVNDGKIPLESGILYSYQLSSPLNFNHKYKNYEDDSIININTFSNDISINSQKPENNLIQLTKLKEFTLNAPAQGDKIVNFEVHENSANSSIFIEIGHLYRNKLTQNREITYSYLFKKSTGNKFVINFRKFSNVPAKIIYTLNKSNKDEAKEITINKLSKSIIIEESEIKCFDEFEKLYKVCIFDIKVKVEEIKDTNDSLDFSLQLVKYDGSTLIYLPQNTFMSGLLIPKKKVTYYTEFKENIPGKIFVDLLGGEGNIDAQIKTKDGKDVKPLTYSNKYIDIQGETLSKCNNGCYIYINLNLNLDETKSNYEYNIYFKTETNLEVNLNVPEGEYVYGYLDGNKLDYYSAKIVKKKAKISFYVNCEDCILKLYNINGYNIDNYYSMKKAQFIFNLSDDLTYVKYSIENNNKEISNKKYSIKVVSFFTEESLIVPINSIRSEFCSINQGSPCYFFVSNEDYNLINNLKFLVPNTDNAIISIAECTQNIYDESIITFIKDSTKYGTYPKNNYLSIPNNKKDLIVRVQLDYNENITFVSSIHELISERTNNNYYQEEYNIIDLGTTKEIKPFEKGLINYEMHLIEGRGYIMEKSKKEKYMLESGFQENINIIDSNENSNIELSLDGNNIFILYYRIVFNKNNKSNNLIEINFQKSNYIKYLNKINETSFWPLYFFMKLKTTKSQIETLKDIHFNYKFSNKYKDQSFSNELFKIKIYVANHMYTFNSLNTESKKEELILNKTDYIYEFTSGYALIEAEEIRNKSLDFDDNYYYLIIEIDTDYRNMYNEINLALTLFDLTDNYVLPMNEYLLMLINGNTNINLGRDFSKEYTPFIELAHQSLNYNFNDTSINPTNKYGKLFSNLAKNQKYILTLNKKSKNEIEKPNIITKYAISDKDIYSYFNLTDGDVKNYDTKNKIIKFKPVTIDKNYLPSSSSYFVYNIRYYDRLNNRYFSPESIFEEKATEKSKMKCIGQANETEVNCKIDLDELSYGLYYISILAEARKGSVYEYFLYDTYNISKITDEYITVNIIINTTKQYKETGYARKILFKGDIKEDGKFIKLYVTHKHPLEKNFIYASQSDSLKDSNDLYRDSEFKTIDRETALIIPMESINRSKPLYIRIPCDDVCDYDFHYVVYTDNITINDDQCFDIKLKSDIESYKFIYNTEKKNINSLFTITGYSLNDFSVTSLNKNANKTYFNGYSYLINNDQNKEFEFEVKAQERIKICHRFLNIGKNAKDIIDGDKIYSKLIDSNYQECFNINNEANDYSLTFISKTKNIKATFTGKNNQPKIEEDINEESKNIILGKEYNKLCLSKPESIGEDAGVFFQLVSVKESQESPKMNLTLIKGVSTLQKIKKGQYIYYRMNEHSSDSSSSINIQFQNITGHTEVKLSECKNFPNCSFSEGIILNKYFLNNIYYNYNITPGEDIYHKPDFPAVIVHCLDNAENEEEYCNYYIEMSNEKDTKLLNKDNKIYTFIQDNEETYKINKNSNDKIYLQIRTLAGEVNVESSKNYKFEYYNNTKFLLFNDSSEDINISIKGTKNSLINIYYYSENETHFYLSNGEVQYNIISENETRHYYFYHKLSKNNRNKYIVSINAINCYLNIKDDKEEKKGIRYYQNITGNNSTLSIKWNTNDFTNDVNDKCEFTISASEIINNNPKELIINDGMYYYYSLNNINGSFNSVVLHYLFSKNEEKKNILININKKSDNDLNLIYEFKYKNNQETRLIKKYNDLFYINYQNDKNKNLESNYLDSIEYLIITITTTKIGQIDFRINVNGRKNIPIYLDPEEIEYGIVQNGEKALYYFDYYKNKNENENENNHQIFLHSKGTAKIEYISIYNKINEKQISDSNVKNFENFFHINKVNDCENGCRIYFYIYLDGKENNKTSDFNLFNVYRHSNSRSLNVQENTNIYGYFDGKLGNRHLFISKTNSPNLTITLNCPNCVMSLSDKKQYDIKITNTTTINFTQRKESFEYEITSEKEGYYYFSFTYINSNKYIDQLEPEKCFLSECIFILPLHKYYMYTQNNIILFVPDYEQAEISYKFDIMNEYENNTLERIDFPDSNSGDKYMTNRLLVDISDHYNKNEYLLIKVARKHLEGLCTLMISQFYNSLNSLKIPYREKIYINDNVLNETSLEYSKYKFDLILINGGGSVSFNLNTGEKYTYYLNYDSRESMSLIMEMEADSSMITQKISENETFIYYLNITKREDEEKEIDKLVLQKVNTFKYYEDVFPLNYTILLRHEDLIINFRFSNLTNTEDGIYDNIAVNTENESFEFEIYGIMPNNETKITPKELFYSNSLRRGYIYLNYSNGTDKFDHYELRISKNSSEAIKPYKYKSVFLEITPLYIGSINKEFNLPRNTYLQLEVNSSQEYSFSFYKPNDEYQEIRVELANSSDIKELNVNKNYSTHDISGKKYLDFKNIINETKLILKFNEQGKILIKNTPINIDLGNFIEIENKTAFVKNNNDNITYHITQPNIIMKSDSSITPDYKVVYLIRLFNILDYYDQDEIDNILFPQNLSIKSFRKELNEHQYNQSEIGYDVPLGKLPYSQYYLSIIGEISYNDTVEYFAFHSGGDNLRIMEEQKPEFDYTWVYVLVTLVVILILLIVYLVRYHIKNKDVVKNEIIDDKKQFLMNQANN